jgi:chromosome segregation ATPase
MGSFKWALLGYRRGEVEAAIATREARIGTLETNGREAEQELASLSGMVIEREREIRNLGERLREANERHDRSIASLESTASRLEEIQAQARGQATRIRMKALREAVEVSRRTQELADVHAVGSNGSSEAADNGLFQGEVKLEIGPLGDFSQLVGFEDVIGALGASEISVERFSEGRATLSVRLDEPVELLRELEERAPLEFRVRRTSGDDLVLDVDEDQGPEQRAA